MWFGAKLVMLNGQSVTPDRLGSFGTYYPYGEDRGTGNPPADREKFATYTRDSVTGLDYAVNRYYNSVSGRFLTADPYMANNGGAGEPNNPGSWNRYAYTRGDPVNRFDPFGTCDQSSDTDHSVTVCSGDNNIDLPVHVVRGIQPHYGPLVPTHPGPNPIQMAYSYALSIVGSMKSLPGLNPCDALAQFASGIAVAVKNNDQFVKDFGVLVPEQFASRVGLWYYNSQPVLFWSSGPSGYSAGFQNTVDDSPSGNGDQGHHFAAFFEYGYLHPNAPGGVIATIFEEFEAGFGIKGPINEGDINLGIVAFKIGADLSNQTINRSDVAKKIQELCTQ